MSILLIIPASATILYQQDFEALTAGSIDTQDGWGGQNLGDPAPGSIVPGSIGGGGGSQVLDMGGGWNGRDVTLTNETIYYGFTLNVANRTGGTTANEMFMRIGGWDTFVQVDAVNDEIEARIGNTSTTFGSVGLVEGSFYRVVGKLNWNGSAFDSHSVYLNPTGPVEDAGALIGTHSNTTSVAGATRITLRNDDTDSLVDNLVIATTWAEAIPEPSVVGLLGIGALALQAYVRRRRS